MAPIRDTILLPTASTAPRGEVSVGPCGAVSCTRKSLICVVFHTPTVPLETCISLAKMNPQSSDSYHPRASGDHSNECTLIGDGSIPTSCASRILLKAAGSGASDEIAWRKVEIRAESCCISVRVVCSGNSSSQLSIHCAEGSNTPDWDWPGVALPRLGVLLWREKLCAPAGSFPLAFSDMPCICLGTSSSAADATEQAAEGFSLGLDAAGVGRSSSSLSSSSSPIANAASSAVALPCVGVWEGGADGLLVLSIELLVELGSNGSCEAAPSFLRRFRLSISCWPLSNVKERKASNFFLLRSTAKINNGFSAVRQCYKFQVAVQQRTNCCIDAQ
jgi:hypothetical protein